ncbi:hypothetical protein ACFL1U_00845 [Patescibacteria group bacterium]
MPNPILKHTIMKRWWLPVLTLLIAVIVVSLWGWLRPQRYASVVTMTVQQIPVENVAEFTYEGFYGSQAAEQATRTLQGLIESPILAQQIFENAEMVPPSSINKLRNYFRARTTGPHILEISYSTDELGQALELESSLNNEIERLVFDWNREVSTEWEHRVQIYPAVTEAISYNYFLLIPLAAIGGLLIGLLLLAAFPVRLDILSELDLV